MSKKLFYAAVFMANTLLAVGPTIECHFGALDEEGDVALDEYVAYTLMPVTGVNGDFDPYEIDISVYGPELQISVYLEDEPVSSLTLPVANVVALPVGASLFGVNTVFHHAVDEFVSFRYECLKVLN